MHRLPHWTLQRSRSLSANAPSDRLVDVSSWRLAEASSPNGSQTAGRGTNGGLHSATTRRFSSRVDGAGSLP
jgi:hypothetical protein